MKKFFVAITLPVLCSLNFFETLSATNVNHPQIGETQQNGNSVTQWNAIAIQVLASDPRSGSRLESLRHHACCDSRCSQRS